MRILLAIAFATFTSAMAIGCGGHGKGGGQVAGPVGHCTLYQQGHATKVEFDGPSADRACQEFAQKFSSIDYWSSDPSAGSDEEQTAAVCQLQKEGLVVSVSDIENGIFGSEVCADFQGAGWLQGE